MYKIEVYVRELQYKIRQDIDILYKKVFSYD